MLKRAMTKAALVLHVSPEVHSNPRLSSLHPLPFHLRHIRFLYILHEDMGKKKSVDRAIFTRLSVHLVDSEA